jgi:peroxiredoxin Q/BCP
MAQLRQDYAEFVARQAEVIVIGTDDVASFRYHWDARGYPFIGLPDPQNSVSDLYGQEVKALKFGRLPAMVVIDRGGRIRYIHYGSSASDIPQNRQILNLLDWINHET